MAMDDDARKTGLHHREVAFGRLKGKVGSCKEH